MTWRTSDWHARFRQQARWTAEIRQHIFDRLEIPSRSKVLEVGCGTGALLDEFVTNPDTSTYGLDLNREFLQYARQNHPLEGRLIQSDGHFLPYRDDIFSITFCHFLLMWVTDPSRIIDEMVRVTIPGGAVLALAEPDYGGRIDYPAELTRLGSWQREALSHQGADPLMGRKLVSLFSSPKLIDVEAGVLGGQWSGQPALDVIESEWKTLISDLQSLDIEVTSEEINTLKNLDDKAWELGSRVLFVPTFYCLGRVRN
jgi:SAM-dependent methyltransferase